MFPLTNKEPYIMSTGERTTLGDILTKDDTDIEHLKEALTDEAETRSATGAKNFLPLTVNSAKAANTSGTWSGNEYSYNGITYTLQTDSKNNVTGIVVDGTASAQSNFYCTPNDKPAELEVGVSYIISGCPSGGGTSTYSLWNSANGQSVDSGSGNTFVYSSSEPVLGRIRIAQNAVISNLTFKPMVRLATDSDPTYQPYAMTNKELTDIVTKRVLYENSATTFTADTSVTLSDSDWEIIEILMYTNAYASNARTAVLITRDIVDRYAHVPISDSADRTKGAYFRPTDYTNNILTFSASCDVMIFQVRKIL